jgi:exodeoxyribonuclease VII large subunit
MDSLPLFSAISLSVTDLTRYLRTLLESDELLQDVWVSGEVSNLSLPASGHVYFTLKDEGAALKCVIWKRDALRLRLGLQNGRAVEARGAINIYEQGGQYQLYITSLRPAGEGYLYREFLRLKASLEAEGLFDEGRKREIPARPRKVGIVTSATGAALQDMLNILRGRYPLVEVVLAPCAVQGVDAPLEIVASIGGLNRAEQPDVILVARGGGSLEDLWAFNDERVVRAICGSQAPVITGIGHETDFTLSDFAADLRAPTPTAAAVRAVPDIADLQADLRDTQLQLADAFELQLAARREGLHQAEMRLLRASPDRTVQNARQRLDEMSANLKRAMEHSLQLRRAHWQGAGLRLASLDPRAVLRRGYAIVTRADGAVVKSARQVRPGDAIRVDVSDGSFEADVK